MYKKSIKANSKYLIPFVEGIKYYGSDEIEHAIGTMIILNDEGDILTCKHIAIEFINNNKLGEIYSRLINELNSCKTEEEKKEIEKKYSLEKDTPVLTNINLPFKIGDTINIEIKLHDYLDLAIIKFKGANLKCDNYPVFAKELPLQGQSVCKLGFAFPEYSYFEYSKENENIVMKNEIISSFPLFPMDGIVTRQIVDEKKQVTMFETSTPGLRGQSGGPIFSPEGLVYGIQSMTKHLDLNFDIDKVVKRGIENKKITYTPFINLGVGISSKEIIKFLDSNNIKYNSR
ncbi:MAG: trypsin-like peptidase domain-containing protein [Bacilli bacterium]|nr:trypsin-like peptidase domain-containing protein [Bacilli bacterium]